jgi:very-short-patch-repair endonuclease
MTVKPPLPTTTLEYSRQLRRETTDAERAMWRHLRSRQLDGLKFRRQHPIPPYIVDFCCIEKGLIIELDGSQHTPQSDSVRTRALEAQGWTILRFWDNDVLLNIEAVLDAMWNAVREPTLTPTPLPVGEGL